MGESGFDHGFPVSNIAAAMGHTIEVHLESYARFVPDGTADLYAKRNKAGARVLFVAFFPEQTEETKRIALNSR